MCSVIVSLDVLHAPVTLYCKQHKEFYYISCIYVEKEF